MPESFLGLSLEDQREFYTQGEQSLGRLARVLEKDVMLCWALQRLFEMPNRLRMAFKGGTSLSKVYQVIERFSEDIDITIDYREFTDVPDMMGEGLSGNQRRRIKDQLRERTTEYVSDTIVPYLQNKIDIDLPGRRVSINTSEDLHKVYIEYESALPEDQALDANRYVQNRILLEFGGRNFTEPNERREIRPYLAELQSQVQVDFPVAFPDVLRGERTFWEKATLIHAACSSGYITNEGKAQSRHWCDLMLLSDHAIGRSSLTEYYYLLNDVSAYKAVAFNRTGYDYPAACRGAIRLVPDGELLRLIRTDYAAMSSEMFPADYKVPTMDEIFERLRALENEINKLAGAS